MIKSECRSCGWRVFHVRQTQIDCPRCSSVIVCNGELRPVVKGSDEQWPKWARAIRRLRKPDDAGVGDTFQRLASGVGGELFKTWTKKLGIPCNCERRQADWNEKYRY